MPRIEWTEAFELQIPEIDEQHRRWVDIINELHDSLMSHGGAHNLTERTLNEMIDYGRFHFTFEEEYLKKIGYPELAMHRSMHNAFMKDLINKLQQERGGGLILNTEIMKVLTGWLQSHIQIEDRKYSRFAAQT
ncbi:MAG: bacteriohemerythrin [Proteobacteria bacterium]|nr:bacteriohemerythrin [Pseudomonadota bacterium]MBU1737949.1 bacteriohemerythrin [Pseudomonadota bacterium]